MKLLVHLHVYYHDQVDWFIGRLGNISGCEWDLVVTSSTVNPLTEEKLRAFKPDARFLHVDNVGYDSWPFIFVIRSVDISGYDLVMKLHTKNLDGSVRNRINGNWLTGEQWRALLVDPLLNSSRSFLDVLHIFESDPAAGAVFERALYKTISKGLPEDLSMLENELARLGVTTKSRWFCAGSMFMARMAPFRKLKECDIEESIFAPGASHNIGTYAHVYERIFGILVADCGLECRTLFTDMTRSVKAIIDNIVTPSLSFIFSLERVGESRAKVVRLFGFRFRLGSGKDRSPRN